MERNRGKHLAAIEVRLRELLISARAGSDSDYLIFLKEITSHIRGYFKRRLQGLSEDVEDLVQETLMAVHSHRHTYDKSLPLTVWMYAIARYKMVDFLRNRSSEGSTIPIEDALEVLDYCEVLATDARIDIEGMLAKLPDRFRIPIDYVKIKGLSVTETAKLTGMSESAVKIGIHRGLKELGRSIRGRP